MGTSTGAEGGLRGYTGAKVFTATRAQDREKLGQDLTQWLEKNPTVEIVDTVVRQSSDQTFHCLSIVVFYRD